MASTFQQQGWEVAASVVPKRRRGRGNRWTTAAKKPKWFDGFSEKTELEYKGRKYTMTKTAEKEVGVHSLQWALEVKPQESPFLKLPLEIRERICEHAISCPTNTGPCNVRPQKQLKKIRDAGETARLYAPDSHISLPTYNALSLVSRQVYIEVVGSGILYRIADFHFGSPAIMFNYLDRINPIQKARITRIVVEVGMTKAGLETKFFDTLQGLTSLQRLRITIFGGTPQCSKPALALRRGAQPVICKMDWLDSALKEKSKWEALQKLPLKELTWGWWFSQPGNNGVVVSACQEKDGEVQEELRKLVLKL